uniref:Uncharacterized protein n=1 Tax=Ditylenchus dipsaci TaxID=166011 RepID=A0A915EJX0_9BILA
MLNWLSEYRRQFLPSISKRAIFRHYIPASGAVSHSLFTAHLFTPIIISRFFPVYDMALSNVVLFNSHLGIGFFVFFRPHLYHLNAWNRVEYSVFASVVFNFGSILLTILLKSFLPKRLNSAGRSIAAVCLSIFMMRSGYKYIKHIDSRTKHLKDFNFEHAGAPT